MKSTILLNLGLANCSWKRGFSLGLPVDPIYRAIGFVATHYIPLVFVYEEEAQNLKEGTWYPYKVFFPTPNGWLKVEGNSLHFMADLPYGLSPVETKSVLKEWGDNNPAILKILGL